VVLFPLPPSVETAYQTFYAMDTGVNSTGVVLPGRKLTIKFHVVQGVSKNDWSYGSISPYAFAACRDIIFTVISIIFLVSGMLGACDVHLQQQPGIGKM
jgi:hypothetical protein